MGHDPARTQRKEDWQQEHRQHHRLLRREGAAVTFLSPADLPDPGIEPGSPALQADSLATELSGKPLPFLSLPQNNIKYQNNKEVTGNKNIHSDRKHGNITATTDSNESNYTNKNILRQILFASLLN